MMRLLFVFLLFCASGFTQTKMIAHKSHGGNSENFNPDDYTDNFGLSEPIFYVNKVKLINSRCVVEFSSTGNGDKYQRTDTLCDHPYFSGQYTFEQIKQFYPEGTKFIGFENKFFHETTIPKKDKKLGVFSLFGILLSLGFIGLYLKDKA